MTGYARYPLAGEGKFFDDQGRNDIHFVFIWPFPVLMALDTELCDRFFQQDGSLLHIAREVAAKTVFHGVWQLERALLIIACCFCPTLGYCEQEQRYSCQQKNFPSS